MAGAEEVIATFIASKHKREEGEFLFPECLRDLERGTAGPLCTKDEMDKRRGAGRWLPLPRFQIVQASGKERPIDEGARNGHNEMVMYSETLYHPSPVQPAIQLRA